MKNKVRVDYKGVLLRQDDRDVLTDVHLTVREGELVYIMGDVGSGKSSLLKSIYGELRIAEGEAIVMDTPMKKVKMRKLPRLRKQLGIVFQDFQLLRDRTVFDNLSFVLRATGWKKKKEREACIREVLQQVKLEDKIHHMPYELSGGEQQGVSIARALLNSPGLLIADEPTANLDSENALKVMALIDSIRTNGTAVIMATHNENLPVYFPGRVLVCQGGKLTEEIENNKKSE